MAGSEIERCFASVVGYFESSPLPSHRSAWQVGEETALDTRL